TCILIDDQSQTISTLLVDRIIKNRGRLKTCPRLLLHSEQLEYPDLKVEIYRIDALIELNSEDSSTFEKAAQKISDLHSFVFSNHGASQYDASPLEIIRGESSAQQHCKILIKDIAALGPLVNEYEYAIKMLLKRLSTAFKMPITSIYIQNEDTIFTLISDLVTEEMLNAHTCNFKGICPKEIDRGDFTEVVWGRHKTKFDPFDSEEQTYHLVDLVLKSKDTVLGYIAIPKSEYDKIDEYYLELISLQASMFIISMMFYRAQKSSIKSHHLRLGALNETCRLFSNLDGQGFGLQFLLIILEYIAAHKGILALTNEDGKLTDTFFVGFSDETRRWLIDDNSTLPWENTLNSDQITQGSIILPLENENSDESKMYYIGYPLSDVQGKLGVIILFFWDLPLDYENLIPFCTTMATLASTHYANLKLYKEFLEKRLMDEQINIAREIQQDLLPKEIPDTSDFVISAASKSAKQVGGDFFDYLRLSPAEYVLVIGDVSGKGIPASLLMSMTKSLLKFHFQQKSDLCEIIADVNTYLANETPSEKFVTSQLVLICEESKTVEMVNAGHNPLLIFRADSRTFEEMDADGLALGVLPDMEYAIAKTSYSSGDIFLMYTDGLSEAMSPTREQFGMEKIMEIIMRMSDKNADDILDELYRAIQEHADGDDQHDDTTVLVLKAK
ncbi:PP2C family protein-serine/threonine phosphatase, partial [bacterium]|nr:PP2C family protein-serine/threonine phosphatase [bacterium]MBU1025583.1 PP2C family protein-serine/threonine phosphatase [bacterium]